MRKALLNVEKTDKKIMLFQKLGVNFSPTQYLIDPEVHIIK